MESASCGAAPVSASSPEASNTEAQPASSAALAVPQAESLSQPPSRYESQKRRDWNTFLQYLRNHKPPLTLARCSGAHVIEFLKYLDQFGKTKVHVTGCPYYGHPKSALALYLSPRLGVSDALIGRLRAAYEENEGRPESNPFGERAVTIYLREVKEGQAKARGIPYEKKKKKRKRTTVVSAVSGSDSGAAAVSGSGGNGGSDDTSAGAGVASVSTAPPIVTTTNTTVV